MDENLNERTLRNVFEWKENLNNRRKLFAESFSTSKLSRTTMILYLYILRIISLLLMYSGLIIGSFCTLFILHEFYKQSYLRTSLNLLLILIFTVDCLRAMFCSPLESFVLIQTWHSISNNCNGHLYPNKYIGLIFNFCRITMSIRTCFNIIQPLGFIGIAYERLRTIVQRNGSLNLNRHQQGEYLRLKYTILWICLSLVLGIGIGIYQGIIYSTTNTCYNHISFGSQLTLIIRIVCISLAILISGMIYGRIYFLVKKYQKTRVTTVVNTIERHAVKQRTRNYSIDVRKKNYRLAKQTFILFLSFFLCRIPSMIIAIVSLLLEHQSPLTKCILDEFINISYQLSFLTTISDPIVYIYSQPTLKEKFRRNHLCICKNLFSF